jgi:hypothetical protein
MSLRLAQDAPWRVPKSQAHPARARSRHLSPSAAGQPAALAADQAALDVDLGKLIELKLSILAQLLAFAREIRLFGVGETDAAVLAP